MDIADKKQIFLETLTPLSLKNALSCPLPEPL